MPTKNMMRKKIVYVYRVDANRFFKIKFRNEIDVNRMDEKNF